jgi:hypothetical protein
MTLGSRPARTWISLVIALVFAIAAMPGAMAMPAPTSHASHSMAVASVKDCCAQGQSPCQHMKAHKDHGKPCKNMVICLGMLNCFGMGAIDVAAAAPPVLLQDMPVAISHQTVSGLTLTPDNPPPIA